MLETIRQFAEEQLAADGATDATRTAHARYFAAQAVALALWEGPDNASLHWVNAEFANLRAGFRWAADHADLDDRRRHRDIRGVPRFSGREL